eukprot:14859059-Heterocapsa_arctica.AAC.1
MSPGSSSVWNYKLGRRGYTAGRTRSRCSRIFLWMVWVLKNFKRRRISPATRHRKAAEWGERQAVVKR